MCVAEQERSRWVCNPQITVRIDEPAGSELLDVAGRLGAHVWGLIEATEKPFHDGIPLQKGEGPRANTLFKYLCTVQAPSPHFFLEAVVWTDVSPELFPEDLRPDDEGFLRIETHDIYELIRFVYRVSELLELSVPGSFSNLVYGPLEAGGDYAEKCRREVSLIL